MTPQEIISKLRIFGEDEGRQLLHDVIPSLNSSQLGQVIDLLKRQADQQWTYNPSLSFRLAGYLVLIGDLVNHKSYRALGLMARGDALRRLDKNQEALPFFDAAGEEFLEADDEVGWARTRIGRISACLQLNRPTDALRDAALAREVFMRHHKYLRAGQIDVNAAIVNYELGSYEEALRLFDRAIKTYGLQSEGVELNIARAKSNKALALAAQGKFPEAVALNEQARATFEAHEGQQVAVARADLNIAQIYALQGHYSQALLLFDRSRAIFLNHQLELEAAEVAQLTCFCLVRLNRAREAYRLGEETVDFFRGIQGYRPALAYSLMYQAEASWLLGQVREADDLLQEAKIIMEEGGFLSVAARVRLRQAELYFVDGQFLDSQREARLVADQFAEQEALPELARVSLLQARIAAIEDDQVNAQYLCQQALDIADGQNLLDLKYRCFYLLGQLAEGRNDLEKAFTYYDQAVLGIDDVQSRLVMDARTSFLEDKGEIYLRAVLLALRLKRVDQALIYVEKAKSRVLGDYLRNNIDIRLKAGSQADEVELDRLSRLREEQSMYSSIVYDAEHPGNLSDTAMMRIRTIGPAKARKEMQDREQRIEKLLEQIQLHLLGDLVGRANPRWTDRIIHGLSAALDPQTLVLEYYIAEQDIYIFQLSGRGIKVHVEEGAVSKLERLESLWRANLDLAAQAAGQVDRGQAFAGLQENCQGLLQRLYNILIRPIEEALRQRTELIVIPYGSLHYLPLHCLYDGEQFLIERLNVSYLPSAALLDICRQRGKKLHQQGQDLTKSLVMGLSDKGRLEFAVDEAKGVAQQLSSPCFLNQEATVERLTISGEHSPLIHIAAHGLFRLDAPNFSFIKLADHQLSTIEVFNLDFSACSLVTLSACETGRAVVGGVDEVIGLGRGFLYSGAASLLPTLWKVDDASSAELMKLFYRLLLTPDAANSRPGKARALAAAQRRFLAQVRVSDQPYLVHPYFWAAFHLIGDPGPI